MTSEADGAAPGAQHPGLGTGRHLARRRGLAVDAAVTRVVAGLMGLEGGDLAVEAQDGAAHQGLLGEIAGVVDQETGGKVVAAVGDHVVVRNQVEGVAGFDPALVGDEADVGVDGGQRPGGAFHLGPADRRGRVHDLALEIGEIHGVVVDHPDGTHPGRRQVQQQGRAQPAGADHQHPGIQQPRLALAADLAQQDVARITLDLLLVKVHLGNIVMIGGPRKPADRQKKRDPSGRGEEP